MPAAPSAIVAHDGEQLWLVRQPREATGEPDLLELPAGRLTRRARRRRTTARRELAEEIGKAADHWEHLVDLLHDARLHERAVPRLPRHRPARRARPGDRGASGSTSRAHPLSELDDARRLRPRLEDAHRPPPPARPPARRGLSAPRPDAAAAGRRAAPARRAPPPPWAPRCTRKARVRRGESGGVAIVAPAHPRAALRAPPARLPRLPRVRARPVPQHPGGVPLGPAPVRRLAPAHGPRRAGGRPRRAGRVHRRARHRAARAGRPPRPPRSSARRPACARSTATCAARTS